MLFVMNIFVRDPERRHRDKIVVDITCTTTFMTEIEFGSKQIN